MSRSVDPTELLMDLGFGGPAINSLARIPSRFFTKSHVSYIPNNIGHEYLMSFYLKVVLLSNRMTSGIHTHSDSGIGIIILREFRDLEKLLLNMSTLKI